MRWEKSATLLELARLLAGSGEGLTLDRMAAEAGVERRTAERMRDMLQQLFPQLEEVSDGRSKRFRIRGGLESFFQMPTADEMAELDIATRQLAATGNDSRAALLRSLQIKINAALRTTARRRMEPDLEALLSAETLAMQAGPRVKIEPDTLATIRQALKSGQSVCFSYQASNAKRQVAPWGIIFGRLPYLVGPAAGYDKPVLWRLDRMSHVEAGEPCRAAPPSFSLPDYAARSFGAYQEELQDVELRFTPASAPDALRYLFHPDQAVTTNGDGSLTVRFRAGGMLELAHHLFTWADAVEIVAPRSLREMMCTQLKLALARHAGAREVRGAAKTALHRP